MLLHNCKREIVKLNSNNVIIFFQISKNYQCNCNLKATTPIFFKNQTVSYKNFKQKDSYKLTQ